MAFTGTQINLYTVLYYPDDLVWYNCHMQMSPDRYPGTRRQRVIDAAKRLLKNNRYEDLNLNTITREAGISRGTFYTYFDSKEALRQALKAEGVDGLEVKDRRAAIIEAALRTFAERGFHATSLEDIAEAAGTTKGTVYWYFKQKSDLLRAAAEHVSPLVGQLDTLWGLLEQPPEEVLPRLVRTCLDTFKNPMAGRLFRLVIAEAPHHPEIAEGFALIINRVLEFFTSYLRRQTELERLRPSDTESSARSFMGMLLVYIIGHEIFPLLGTGFPEPGTYAENVVEIFLKGLGTPVLKTPSPEGNLKEAT